MKYTESIKKIIEFLGGKDNISSAAHCVSRVRLVLKDSNLLNDKEINELKDVKGTIKLPNNQYHIIIGTDVPNFYNEFIKEAGISESSKEEIKLDAANKGSLFQRMLQNFSDIFIPIIPVIVAAGLILGIRNIFETEWEYGNASSAFVNKSQFIKGLNDFLWIPAQAGLWFLPVFICWSVFKKMKGTQTLGILIGLTLLIPPLLNVYEISGKGVVWIWDLDLNKFGFDFGLFKFPWKIAYTAQVLPAIGAAFLGVYVERLFNKITTPVLRQIVVPFMTILLTYSAAMAIIGPIGWIIGTGVGFGVNWALTNYIARYFFAPIFGLVYAPLVLTGLHHMLNAVMLQEVASNGGTIFFPILAISNICQGIATLAFTIIHKKNEKVSQIGYSATTSAFLGVTEPSMYGINLKYLYPFLAAIIGSSIGAFLIVITGTSANGIGNGGWLGVLSMQSQSPINNYKTWGGTGFLWFIVAAIVASSIAFFGTFFFRGIPKFKKLETKIGV